MSTKWSDYRGIQADINHNTTDVGFHLDIYVVCFANNSWCLMDGVGLLLVIVMSSYIVNTNVLFPQSYVTLDDFNYRV
jgi:hypothetical protein